MSLKLLSQRIRLILVAGFFCQSQPNLASAALSIPYPAAGMDDGPFQLSQSITQPIRLEIDLSRRQLVLYEGGDRLKTYPVAVGREGWRTPIGDFQVMQMIRNPAWTNPFTGRIVQGGDPANPLGHYWIGFWTDGRNWVGMHGTPEPDSVGREASHGCIRLYNGDIQDLFNRVSVGTTVNVVP